MDGILGDFPMRGAVKLDAFRKALLASGGEILGATNPYEVLRFRTKHGVGVVYSGKRGETWNREALAARDHIDARKGSLAPVEVKGRRKDKATVQALLDRDGECCFFCDEPLEGDVTVEHLVAIAHGGPNHISNLFLAHQSCNSEAGHLSAPEKIARAIAARLPA
jgi:5-methylcytosine-specific restriction endonuclease McrA